MCSKRAGESRGYAAVETVLRRRVRVLDPGIGHHPADLAISKTILGMDFSQLYD